MLQINARGVVLASGGYADNPDMINEYTMHDYDALTVMGSSGRTGNGIRMALELGVRTHVLGAMMMCGGAVKGMGASCSSMFVQAVSPCCGSTVMASVSPTRASSLTSHSPATR